MLGRAIRPQPFLALAVQMGQRPHPARRRFSAPDKARGKVRRYQYPCGTKNSAPVLTGFLFPA